MYIYLCKYKIITVYRPPISTHLFTLRCLNGFFSPPGSRTYRPQNCFFFSPRQIRVFVEHCTISRFCIRRQSTVLNKQQM